MERSQGCTKPTGYKSREIVRVHDGNDPDTEEDQGGRVYGKNEENNMETGRKETV